MKKILDIKEGDLLTLDQTSKILGKSKKCLRHWRSKSKLHPDKYPASVNIGGTIYFLKADILDRLNQAMLGEVA